MECKVKHFWTWSLSCLFQSMVGWGSQILADRVSTCVASCFSSVNLRVVFYTIQVFPSSFASFATCEVAPSFINLNFVVRLTMWDEPICSWKHGLDF